MKSFPLIKELQNPKERVPLAPGVQYQEWNVEVKGHAESVKVHIPIRETENFTNALVEYRDNLDDDTLKIILREHRGIRG